MAEFMGFLLMVFLIFQDILVREEDDGSAEKTISRKQKINSGPDQNPNENDMWREPIFSGALFPSHAISSAAAAKENEIENDGKERMSSTKDRLTPGFFYETAITSGITQHQSSFCFDAVT